MDRRNPWRMTAAEERATTHFRAAEEDARAGLKPLPDAVLEATVTLDGHPAVLAGARLNFPVVRCLRPECHQAHQAEWSRSAIQNIILTRNGAFRT